MRARFVNGLSASFTRTLLPSTSRTVNFPAAFIQADRSRTWQRALSKFSSHGAVASTRIRVVSFYSVRPSTLTAPAFRGVGHAER